MPNRKVHKIHFSLRVVLSGSVNIVVASHRRIPCDADPKRKRAIANSIPEKLRPTFPLGDVECESSRETDFCTIRGANTKLNNFFFFEDKWQRWRGMGNESLKWSQQCAATFSSERCCGGRRKRRGKLPKSDPDCCSSNILIGEIQKLSIYSMCHSSGPKM